MFDLDDRTNNSNYSIYNCKQISTKPKENEPNEQFVLITEPQSWAELR